MQSQEVTVTVPLTVTVRVGLGHPPGGLVYPDPVTSQPGESSRPYRDPGAAFRAHGEHLAPGQQR